MKEKQVTALELLASCKFLTSSQFVQLNLYKNRGDVTNALKSLLTAKRPLVGKKNFQPNPTYGKVESIYYLTKYGRDYLIKNLNYNSDDIKYVSKDIDLFQTDYDHRRYTVDFYIQLRQWAESKDGDITFCHYYFDKVGNNRVKDKSKHLYALNRLELQSGDAFIPDIITMFKIDDREYLFLFEQHNGNSTNRLVKQLQLHLQSISEDLYEKQFGFQRSPRIVIVCENDTVKSNTIKRLKQDEQFDNFHNFFIFKSNSELLHDFNHNWSLIDGQKVSFIQPKKTN
ncbi:MAG: replication-relaxation family protein [Gammaproteobacteria bacterium]|nr:replication-relaxation family protein [Gammaproteobacteria bacterium]